MKPYGQKRDWAEIEQANKYDRGKNKARSKKRDKTWKKRARRTEK